MMHFADAAAWESWLAEHHQTEGGVWLKITKKGASVTSVKALTAVGRMRPPGLAQVFAAQADGRWAAAYAAQRNATVPPDLAAALAAHSLAAARFEALGKTDRYRMILPLLTARTPAGRTARLQKAIADLLNQ